MRVSALLLALVATTTSVSADTGTGLYPPGLVPAINRANGLLGSGQFADAARAYSEAIDLSPADYMLYYKRGTAHLSLQRHPQALADFQRVLELSAAPPPATHLHIARLFAKAGDFADARSSVRAYTALASAGTGDRDAQELLVRLTDAEAAWAQAERARKAGLWTACVEAANTALSVSSHSPEIRGTRAECGIAGGNIELGVSDLSRLSQIVSPSSALFMRIFRITYFLLPPAATGQGGPLATLKQCLHFDPDSKPCRSAHRLVKGLDKTQAKLEAALAAGQWSAALKLAGGPDGLLAQLDAAAVEHAGQDQLRYPAFAPEGRLRMPLPDPAKASPRLAAVLGALCRAHLNGSPPRALKTAAPFADRLLAMDLEAPQMEGVGTQAAVDALLLQGEAALAREDWELASRVLQHAFEKSGRDRDVYSRMQRAQKLLKQSKQKDYYKVLGVARDADERTIKKAFRTAAKTAHPDKGGSEAKMAAVNEAYEVLSDPELRARFDNGDDPNDPASAQGGGGFPGGFPGGGMPHGHPFAHFFQGGGGGGGRGSGPQFHFQYSGGGH